MAGRSNAKNDCGWWLRLVSVAVIAGLALQPAYSAEETSTESGSADVHSQPVADEFKSPQEISRQFCRILGEMAKDQSLPTPRDLVTQLGANASTTLITQPAPEQRLSAEQVFALARKSVVIVGGITRCPELPHWHGSFASGFVISRDGIIVTNAHVIEAMADTSALGVMTHDGRVLPVMSVLAGDRENDVALMRVEADNLTPLPIASAVPVGATIYCLSHPAVDCAGTEHAFYTFTTGIVAGKFRLPLGGKVPVNALAITADYAQGSSGGPILNEHGAVVGVVCHTVSLCARGDPSNVQMTWKMARPSDSVLSLVRGHEAQNK